MKLRMYLPEEIAELKNKFQFFADTDAIYVLNKGAKSIKSFKHSEPIICRDTTGLSCMISRAAVSLWLQGMIRHYHLFDIHNAVMMCRINSEEPTWDNVEKYL